jgi:hypothetical protein
VSASSQVWLRSGDVLGLQVLKEGGETRILILDETDNDEPPLIQATLSVEEVGQLIRLLEEASRA